MNVRRDIDAELRFHLDARIEELIGEGLSPHDAHARALAEFGDVDETRARLREIDTRVSRRRSRADRFDALCQDIVSAARALRRTPGVSLTIIITLALGIGANAAMFSLLDVIYLRPPAGVAHPASVHRVWVERRFANGTAFWPGFDYPSFEEVKRSVAGRAQTSFYYAPELERLGRGENAPPVQVSGVGAEFFDLLGIKPASGRLFAPDELAPESTAPVAVISDAFWHRQFAANPAAIGQTIPLGTQQVTIVGVTPPGFRGIDLEPADVWVPAGTMKWDAYGSTTPWWRNTNVNWFQVIVRPSDDANDAELAARMTQTLRGRSSAAADRDTLAVAALGAINVERGPGKESTELKVAVRLGAVAVIVLLIACANVVNLLLARAASRRREIGVRLALGISRSRLVRLLVIESLLLAIVATIAALAAAGWGASALRALLMPEVDWSIAPLHWRLIAFALGVAVLASGLTGLVPALQSASMDFTAALRANGRGSERGAWKLRSALVMAQTALSVVLLVGAALFVRSLRNVKGRDVGYTVNALSFARVRYDTPDSARDAGVRARLRELESRIAAFAGVQRVAFTSMPPMAGFTQKRYFPDADTLAHHKPPGMFTAVSPGYFAAIGSRFIVGQGFSRGDAVPGVVINQAMADALWPGENPVGRCIRFEVRTATCAPVVGVVQTMLFDAVEEQPVPQIFISLDRPATDTWGATAIVVRADPSQLAAVDVSLRELLRAEFPGSIPRITTMAQRMEPLYRPWNLGARLFTLFGLLALVVAALGVFSSVSYAVNRRTHEFGVRIALGARAQNLIGQVVGEGLRTVLGGVLVGILLTLLAGRFVASLLYGVSASDPWSIAAVATVLTIVAVVAALRPAWRAARADPMTALRAD